MPRCPPAASSPASFSSIRSSTLITRNPAPASFCAQCDFPAPDIPMRESLSTDPRWRLNSRMLQHAGMNFHKHKTPKREACATQGFHAWKLESTFQPEVSEQTHHALVSNPN